jgi:hypothetical protein
MPAITQEDIVGCQAPFSISEPKKHRAMRVFGAWGSTKEHYAKVARLLTRNQAYEQSYRGFESHPFGHNLKNLQKLRRILKTRTSRS